MCAYIITSGVPARPRATTPRRNRSLNICTQLWGGGERVVCSLRRRRHSKTRVLSVTNAHHTFLHVRKRDDTPFRFAQYEYIWMVYTQRADDLVNGAVRPSIMHGKTHSSRKLTRAHVARRVSPVRHPAETVADSPRAWVFHVRRSRSI